MCGYMNVAMCVWLYESGYLCVWLYECGYVSVVICWLNISVYISGYVSVVCIVVICV